MITKREGRMIVGFLWGYLFAGAARLMSTRMLSPDTLGTGPIATLGLLGACIMIVGTILIGAVSMAVFVSRAMSDDNEDDS